MTTDGAPPPAASAQRLERGGGKEGDEAPPPNRDLAAAAVIGLFAVLAMIFSVRLEVPGSIDTAPGLLPFVTGFTLFVMAVVLGARALRAGAALSAPAGLRRGCRNVLRGYFSVEENRRTVQLAAIVAAYVLLVGLIDFELILPAAAFTLRISSYEVVSAVMVTWILKLFWRASLARCFVTALITVEVLASIFRYGFGIPMPAAF